MQAIIGIIWVVHFFSHHQVILAACHKNCNVNGLCNRLGFCECFAGWEGSDCLKRSCPSGPNLADIPYDLDSAHSFSTCSGRGTCDSSTGNCNCFAGYRGHDCSKSNCFNDCNSRGTCVSMSQIADINDGYIYNRTTSYTSWDAQSIFGCKCDFGWTGADCSQKMCPSGVDPRISSQLYETITLVCDCAPFCSGKFKPQLAGHPTAKWILTSSTATNLANHLNSIGLGNIGSFSSVPILATSDALNDAICIENAITRTSIRIKKISDGLPMLSFYAKLIPDGSIYFETTETLSCDCLNYGCTGTFRLLFDGEMSTRLMTSDSGIDLVVAINDLATIHSANIEAISSSVAPICSQGSITNTVIKFLADVGNIPRLGLWSSVVSNYNPVEFSTVNSSSTLTLSVSDGRDGSVKICNSLGKCNYVTGLCECSEGWGMHETLGPCAKVLVYSTAWTGLGRCPGLVSWDQDNKGSRSDLQSVPNRPTRLFISTNPKYNPSFGNYYPKSAIEYYDWELATINNDIRKIFLNLTSNTSAGPIAVDQARDRIFFVDNNPISSFIGVSDLLTVGAYEVWIQTVDRIFGLAMDPYFSRRKLYWTVPNSNIGADGKIFYASLDETNPVAHSLVSVIGQSNIVDPRGIVIHVHEEKVYWIDRSTSERRSVLRSCSLDGSNFDEVYVFRSAGNHSEISLNLTDIVIDYRHNNTMFFIDESTPPAILAVNLNFPIYNDSVKQANQFKYMYHTRDVVTTWEIPLNKPAYLLIDEPSNQIIWSDRGLNRIKYAVYLIDGEFSSTDIGVIYEPLQYKEVDPLYPLGLAFDYGLGEPTFGNFLQCHGHGRCLGLEGNWRCECDKGYFGDCRMRYCPKGPAWFHEPIVDDRAHDEQVECSNTGLCDRRLGECKCMSGFEGAACERTSCAGQTDKSHSCGGSGRCISLRDLGRKNTHSIESSNNSAINYGSTPYNVKAWDADIIHGCFPDSYGYYDDLVTRSRGFVPAASGPTLMEYKCPRGIPNAQRNSTIQREVQQIICSADAGTFKLSFRGSQSSVIGHGDTVEIIQNKLLMSTSLRDVKVDGTELLCARPYSITRVSFLTETGDLPLMTVVQNRLTGTGSYISISREQKAGSPQPSECSKQGECRVDTGECECWDYWGSSDGNGNHGAHGDCGKSLIE